MNKRILILLILFWLIQSCNVIFNISSINMVVRQGVRNIPNNTGKYEFDPVNAQASSPAIEFLIINQGKLTLRLTSNPIVQISNDFESSFVLDSSKTISEIEPGRVTSFTITFRPKTQGRKSALITIGNNSPSQHPFTFMVYGNANPTALAPEINIRQDTTNIPCNTGSFDFGTVNVGFSSPSFEFTIENLGTVNLILTGNPFKVTTVTGDVGMFIIDESLTESPILPGASTIFTITFRPTTVGPKTTKVTIPNNDSDENPYIFTLTGTAVEPLNKPKINIKQGTNNVSNGGTYNFGGITVNHSSSARIFTIENLGVLDLTLTVYPEMILKSGDNANLFTINQTITTTPIPPGSTTTFTITFSPTSEGVKSTTIVIPNNDSDDNPWIFTATGTGTLPNMVVKQGGTVIPHSTGSYDFGCVGIGASSSEITFTIENTGTGNLILSGTPKIGISGADAAMFAINQTATSSPVTSGNSTTFTVTFEPTSRGDRIATISIANNDATKNPFVFTITGTTAGSAIGWIGGGSNGWKTSNAPSSYGLTYQAFREPMSIYVDSSGNMYIPEIYNNRVSKWDSNGNAIGWIGGGSNGWKTGLAPSAGNGYQSFHYPTGVWVDNAGFIYVADRYNHRISKWNSAGTAIGWIGGGSNGWKIGSGTSNSRNYRSFNFPSDVVLDSAGNIYVADASNNRISKWNSSGNAIGWIGGLSNGWKTSDGVGYATNGLRGFWSPYDIALDSSGNIYVADYNNHRVVKWSAAGNAIGWIGGGSNGWKTGTAPSAGTDYLSFYNPRGVHVDSAGNIFVTDRTNNRISKWNSAGQGIGWIGGGSNGWKTSAGTSTGVSYQSFYHPSNAFVSSDGFIYVADRSNNRISKWVD